MRIYFRLLPKLERRYGTIKVWRVYEENLQTRYPVRYKINHAIGRVVWHCWTKPVIKINNAKQYMHHRFNPKHKYNTIVIGKPGYYEPYQQILRASFTIFETFMKNIYDGNSQVMWIYDEVDINPDAGLSVEYINSRISRWKEMEALYQWWTVERPNRVADLDKLIPIPDMNAGRSVLDLIDEDFKDLPDVKAVSDAYKKRRIHERCWSEQDVVMFGRLTKIYQDLWD